jgi:hypothetical protein
MRQQWAGHAGVPFQQVCPGLVSHGASGET